MKMISLIVLYFVLDFNGCEKPFLEILLLDDLIEYFFTYQ